MMKLNSNPKAAERLAAVIDWFATDADDLTPGELTEWQKWFCATGPTAEECIARAMAPEADGGLGLVRRDRAEKLVARAANQFAPNGGRPRNAKFNSRQFADVFVATGKLPARVVVGARGIVVQGDGSSISFQIDVNGKPVGITFSLKPIEPQIDWFGAAGKYETDQRRESRPRKTSL